MKILINIHAYDFLLCHEALSMAFALAAFDHEIQLSINAGMLTLLQKAPKGKLANMLSSLDLYDMPAAWLSEEDNKNQQQWLKSQSESYAWIDHLTVMPNPTQAFDTVFNL